MGLFSNKISRDELKAGDHIYSWRSYIYSHHGIYVGAGKVIHFTRRGGLEIGTGTYLDKIIEISVPRHGGDNPCPNCGGQSTLDGVISSCLDCFLAGGNLYLSSTMSPRLSLWLNSEAVPALPHLQILLKKSFTARGTFYGEMGLYHLLDNNCEDFAIYCKTGLLVFSVTKSGSSSQVNAVCAAGGVASLALRYLGVGRTAGQAASLAVKYCIGRVAYDVGVRKDVRKVPVEELATLMAAIYWTIWTLPTATKTRAGKVIHFTCRGGLEIGTGTYLDKIIQISVPRHGGDNPCPNCGDQSTLNSVISSCLDCFLAGGNLYLFQYDVSKAILRGGTCTTAPSDPPEEIVHRARYLLSGNGFGEYHLLDNNCEDFAIYCKTGLLVFSVTKSGSSSQVNSVCAAGGVASLALRFLGVGRTAGQAASLAVCPASVVSAAASAISTTLGFVTTGFSAMAVAGYSKYCIGRVAYDVGVRKDIRKVLVDE
ncbi:LOW QUALITY PROTEIN: hypothetical protein HID58_091743, partial [Brassica napus]